MRRLFVSKVLISEAQGLGVEIGFSHTPFEVYIVEDSFPSGYLLKAHYSCYLSLSLSKVHGGSSGIGTFAIQMAKHQGIRVFVSGSEEKLAACKELGADVCINYKTEDFVAKVKSETDGKGVNSNLAYTQTRGIEWDALYKLKSEILEIQFPLSRNIKVSSFAKEISTNQ